MNKPDICDYLITRKISFFKCLRCGHEWIPRGKKPRFCPKCNSSYWDKHRKHIKH